MRRLLVMKIKELSLKKRCHWKEVDNALKRTYTYRSKRDLDYKKLAVVLNDVDEQLATEL